MEDSWHQCDRLTDADNELQFCFVWEASEPPQRLAFCCASIKLEPALLSFRGKGETFIYLFFNSSLVESFRNVAALGLE